MTEPSDVTPARSWTPPTEPESEPSVPAWAEPHDHADTADEDAFDAFAEAATSAGTGWPSDPAPAPAVSSPPAVTTVEPAPEPPAIPDVEPAPEPPPVADVEPAPEPWAPAVPDAAPDEGVPLDAVPGGRSAPLLVAALAATCVLLAALLGLVWWQYDREANGGRAEHARSEALDAAWNAARLIFSYDYRHLDKDFAAGKAVTTDGFRDEYTRTTGKLVDDVALKYRAVVVADVSDAGVSTASTNRAVVLVFVNQQSTSTLAANPRITQSRVEMTLVRVHGVWLVSVMRAF